MTDSRTVLEWFRTRVDHPATVRELLQLFGIPREARASFRRVVKQLVREGALIETRGRHVGLPERMHLVRGRLSVHPNGFAFVEPDAPVEGLAGDLYVNRTHTNEAMHGDQVLARLDRIGPDGRGDGRIVRVVEHRARKVVGRYDVDRSGLGFVNPFDRRLLHDIHVPAGDSLGAASGDMVTVEVTRWPTPTRPPAGRVTEVFGPEDRPGVDLRIIVQKHNLPDAHSERAEAESRRLGGEVRERDLVGRTDFRDLPIVTIDGEHARDFDDAISLSQLENGHYWLGVHIADVAHYVKPGSALDREAEERGTSVYFPERALHMFPATLATNLCSLKPDVDRLVQSVLMEVNGRGQVVRYELHDGVIHSRARMTYAEVNAIVTDGDPETRARYADLVPLFERMAALFAILHGRRAARGSIDFDLPEPEVVLDAEGLVARILVAERNIAHRIIEECMLLANETVAAHLTHLGLASLFRVHEAPDPLKVAEFEAFIGPLGYSVARQPGAVRPADFQRLVEQIRGKPVERAIALLMLRTMQKARYDPADLGHYGLAAEHYLHFTSPIRRYPDLVVHRCLRWARGGAEGGAHLEALVERLPILARHTSEMERRADEAERELVQWKKVRFMAEHVGEQFDGFITGVAPFGLFVELVEHFVEGLVHISTMADDYYHFLEREHALRGDTSKRVYRLGDRVAVQVVRANLERRQVELGLVDVLQRLRRPAARRPRAAGAKVRGSASRPGRREREATRRSRR